MSEKILFDTSVFINSYYIINKLKHEKAIKLIEKYANTNNCFTTYQNITEFINFCKNKLKIPEKELKTQVIEIKSLFKVIDTSKNTHLEALNLSYKKKISFLDTLLLQTAIDNNINIIYTDNTTNFKKIKNIKIKKL